MMAVPKHNRIINVNDKTNQNYYAHDRIYFNFLSVIFSTRAPPTVYTLIVYEIYEQNAELPLCHGINECDVNWLVASASSVKLMLNPFNLNNKVYENLLFTRLDRPYQHQQQAVSGGMDAEGSFRNGKTVEKFARDTLV
jgi:hypothetical protein